MWIKKWSRIRGIARHKVCMVLPISLLFEQNPPVPTAELYLSYFQKMVRFGCCGLPYFTGCKSTPVIGRPPYPEVSILRFKVVTQRSTTNHSLLLKHQQIMSTFLIGGYNVPTLKWPINWQKCVHMVHSCMQCRSFFL